MKEKVDLIIEDAIVMTMDSDRKLIWGGAVAVRGKQIADVGDSADLKEKYEAHRKIDGKNKLVMPGLINAHTHTFGGLCRGLVNDLELVPWIQKKFYLTSRGLDEENYYIATMLLCLEMLKTGTTTFADCGTVQGLEASVVSAVDKIGIKAILARTLADIPDPLSKHHKRREPTTEENLVRGEEFIKDWNNAAEGRIQAWLCPIQVSSISDELCIRSAELANKYDVGLLTHACVSPTDVQLCIDAFNLTPIERFYRLGVLGPNFALTHMGWITEREMLLLKETEASVIHCPSASMKGAYGSISMGKFPELIALGVNVGLGSDGPAASAFQDMVRVLFLASGGHKEARLDPRVMPPKKVVELATVNNSKAFLMSDRIGSLEKSKSADIVIFDLMRPEWIPVSEINLVSNLVYSASGDSVDTVIVDGKVIVENRVVKTVDEMEILERAQKAGMDFSQLSEQCDRERHQ